METNELKWLPQSFYLKPEWRWLRADYLNATGRRRDPRIDDEWVDHARAALKGRGVEKSVAKSISAARDIWSGNPEVKGELEARLLAEEPPDRLVERLGVCAPVLEAYSKLFFAVDSRRKATDWMITQVIGFRALGGFSAPMPHAAWKLAAFYGGPIILDIVIAATTGRPFPEGLVKSGKLRAYDDIRRRLRARLWIAAISAVTDAEFARVAKARRLLRALDARVKGQSEPVTDMDIEMEAFLIGHSTERKTTRKSRASHASLSVLSCVTGAADSLSAVICRKVEEIDALVQVEYHGSEITSPLLSKETEAVVVGSPLLNKETEAVVVGSPPPKRSEGKKHQTRPQRVAG